MDNQRKAAPAGARRSRRRFNDEYKEKLVQETFIPGNSVRGVALRNDINPSLLRLWRQQKAAGKLTNDSGQQLLPVKQLDLAAGQTTSTSQAAAQQSRATKPGAREHIEVQVPGGIVIRVPQDALAATLRIVRTAFQGRE